MTDDLAIVLTAVDQGLSDDESAAADSLAMGRTQSAELDELLGAAQHVHGDRSRGAAEEQGVSKRRPGDAPVTSGHELTWECIVHDSTEQLVRRAVDPELVSLDELLDPDELARIEKRFSGGFELRCDLDRADVAAAITAGLVAALVDLLIVRIPQDTLAGSRGLHDAFCEEGSALTKWMRGNSIPHDNAMSRWCSASFDRVNLRDTGSTLSGSGGMTHRYHTLGHDPLLGLVFGTIDIMRGGLTGIDNAGHLVAIADTGSAHPFLALPREIMHLLSDAPTRMGLPAPGWTLTGLAQFGAVGPQRLTVAEVARQMYIGGYDSRHFLTMATSPAAAELFLRGYWGLRHYFDPAFAEDVDRAAVVAGSHGHLGDHPRYVAMSLVAHTVGTAANAAKIAMYGPAGPFAFNYPQWLAFLRASVRMYQVQTRSASRTLGDHARANALALMQGWPSIDWDGPEAPVLAG